MSVRLYNPTPINMKTMYGGIEFRFPAGEYTKIKTIRKPNEVLVDEDIARRCVEDLGALGLILVDEDDPQTKEEMREEGMRLLEAFIRENNRNFNENQITLANEGRPKQRVPKDLVALNRVLREHLGSDGIDGDSMEVELISTEAFQALKKKKEREVGEIMALAREAAARGDLGALQAILGGNPKPSPSVATGPVPTQPTAAAGSDPEDPEGNPEADSEAMETAIQDPPFRAGHEPGRSGRGGRRPSPVTKK